MEIFNKVYDFFFPIIPLNKRKELWCRSLNKDISYANDIDGDYLDKIGFKKRIFLLYKCKI